MCNNCSKKDWPASMLPRTYVPEKEKIVRVCDCCAYVQEGMHNTLYLSHCAVYLIKLVPQDSWIH